MKYAGMIMVLMVCWKTIAQNTPIYSISGNVTEINGAPIPFANVALYSPDSKIVAGVASDENGKFLLKAKPGSYFLKVSFLSYEEKRVDNLLVQDRDIVLDAIQLKATTEQLKEVVVTGEKSQMDLKLDKRVFYVGKDLTNISANAAEILDNVPSVTVDVEGNVSLRGSQNVRILIDGKPSGITGISRADALRQFQGNMIESIEVITNPSSRYDAEGEVGIINIVLKKNANQGVNGFFTINVGYPANYGASFNVNYRKNKINLFSSYSFNYRESPGRGNSTNIFTENDSTFSYRQTSERVRGGSSNNFRFGADYFLNDKNTITGSVLYRLSYGRNTNEIEYLNYLGTEQLLSSEFRSETEKEPENNLEFTLTYKKEFKQKGRTWTTDFKVFDNNEDEISQYRHQGTDGSTIEQRSNNTEDEQNLLLQSDYVHPLGKEGKLEGGIKATSRVLDNDYLVEELHEGSWTTVANLDNHLIYNEKIYAAYAIVGNKFNKFSVQAGLRGEYSDILVEFTDSAYRNPMKYFNLFPTTHLSYELDEDNSVQLSYSYRISRPGFRDLLPFSGFSDPRSFYIGNANLRPEYTNSFEAGHLLKWAEGTLLSSVYYRYRTGVIQRITLADPSSARTIVFPVNLATQNAYGFEFSLTESFRKWWRLTSNFNFYRAITDGDFNEENYHSDTYTFTGRITSKVTFLKKYDFQASFNYRAPQETTQGKDLSMYSIDLGLSTDVIKGKGTIVLSVRDLMNSRIRRSIVESEGYYSSSEFQWGMRQFLLSFNYRLNQKKDTKARERAIEPEGGSFEE